MNKSSTSKKTTTTVEKENLTNQMKYEVANELGVNLGPDATARQNGSVGGEITRRLVNMAQSNMKTK